MDIDTYIGNLKQKYGYSSEMVQFLKKSIPALIDYYGKEKENIVFATFYNCEIHVQQEHENMNEYLSEYFECDPKLEFPPLGCAFYHTNLRVKENMVEAKSILYIKTSSRPFDFDNDTDISTLIHEMCHAVKGYGKFKLENDKYVLQTGLCKEYYSYDSLSNSFKNTSNVNQGLEEALNSYDESHVMTAMTGVKHEYGSYCGMEQVIGLLMRHPEVNSVIRQSQFTGNDEWIDFFGKENAEFLSKNFDDWVSVLYCSIVQLMKNRESLVKKADTSRENLTNFAKNYTTPTELKNFYESKIIADNKTSEAIQHLCNNQTDIFGPNLLK